MNRPSCNVGNCKENAIAIVHKKFVCSKHLLKFKENEEKLFNKMLEAM